MAFPRVIWDYSNGVIGLTGAIVDIQTGTAWVKEELQGVAVEATIAGNDLANKIHIHCSNIAESFNVVNIFRNKLL